MGEAHLPELGMAALGAEAVGDPNARAMVAEQRAHHTGAPAGADDVQHAAAVTKTHSHCVFFITRTEVSSDATTSDAVTAAAIAEAAASSGACARARMLHSAPSLIDRPKISANSQAQPFEADCLGVVEIDRDGLDGLAERRARLETGRRAGHGALATTGAASAEQPHSGGLTREVARVRRPGLRRGFSQTLRQPLGFPPG